MSPERKGLPKSVIERLTKYLTQVQAIRRTGVEWVSSAELAHSLGLTSSTVRQDLSHVDFSGVSKRGYQTKGLEGVLTRVLGADSIWRMTVVGAGNMGRALALHEEFARRGFIIRGVFDADDRKVGQPLGGLTVMGMKELPPFVAREGIDIGVIAVPSEAAQHVADLLIVSGVKGLLNLTMTHIITPSKVTIIEARIVGHLLELAHGIKFPPSG